MAKEKLIHVRCSDCGTIVGLEKGMFGWKKEKCPKCNKKITYKLEGQKVYVSIGFACNDEKTPEYIDLYQLCDRALNLSRERGSNTSAYY